MIKQLINKNQALTIYLSINLLLIAYQIYIVLFKVFSSEGLSCQSRGFGSGASQACGISQFLFENVFWAIFPIIIIQIILVPSGIITYFSSRYLQKTIKNKYKEQLWYKYTLAVFLYLISALLTTKIIANF